MSLVEEFNSYENEFEIIQDEQRVSKEVSLYLQKLNDEISKWPQNNNSQSNPASKLGKIGGTSVLWKCMVALSKNGTLQYPSDDQNRDCYRTMRSLCVVASTSSVEFCDKCAECGLLEFFVKELKNIKKKFLRNRNYYQEFVREGFKILRNCSRYVSNKKVFLELEVIALAMDYKQTIKDLKILNSEDIEECCILVLSFAPDETELHLIEDDYDVVDYLFRELHSVLSKPNESSTKYQANEIMSAIIKMAKNEELGSRIMQKIEQSEIILSIYNKSELKLEMLTLLCELSFHSDLRNDIVENRAIVNFLNKTKQDESRRHVTEKGLAKLIFFILKGKEQRVYVRSVSESDMETTNSSTRRKSVILCFEKESRSLAVKIKNNLKFKTEDWKLYLKGDDDISDESFGATEIKTFQQASAALLLINKKFQDNLHCRAVAEFLSSSFRRKVVLLATNSCFNSSGWLKKMMSCRGKQNCIKINQSYNSDTEKEVINILSSVEMKISECSGDVETDDDKDDEEPNKSISKPPSRPPLKSSLSQPAMPFEPTDTPPKKKEESKTSCSSPEVHVMLSYQHDFQDLILKMREELISSGYKVWMDNFDMGEDMIESMMLAVENSAAFIMCMSESYEKSKNCRLDGLCSTLIRQLTGNGAETNFCQKELILHKISEALHARKKLQHNNIIPLIVEDGYNPKNWLDFLMEETLYLRVENNDYNDAFHIKLKRRLGKRGKIEQ